MIEVRQLTKRYGSKVAVDALTFDEAVRLRDAFPASARKPVRY